MRGRWLTLCLLVAALGASQAAAQGPYYLALGDSLAIGLQPSGKGVGVDVPTNQGYVDDLYAFLRTRDPDLRLAKLGCSGETTTSMANGGICEYAAGSQLAQAVEFLKTHQVSLITIDIGANDVDHCLSPVFDQGCIEQGIAFVESNLPTILGELRAASPNTPILAMNYYDPFLAAWLLGASGRTLAEESEQGSIAFNGILQGIYAEFMVPVADVASAFRIRDFTPVPFFNVPLNVFLTVVWTWAAVPAPFGPDIHPNALGYAVIADTFVKQITKP